MKICGKCEIEKDESEFYKDKYQKDGLENRCKSCKKEDNKLRYIKRMAEGKCCHCGKDKEDKTQWRCNECKAKLAISTIKYKSKLENRQKIAKQKECYYEQNKEYILERGREHYTKPETKIKKKAYKEKYNADPEKRELVRKNKREYEKERCRIDPAHKLMKYLRSRIHGVLKGQKKTISTKDWIGCSPEKLVEHIESQWTEGMSWLNYGNKEGQWSVDHVFPFHLCDQNDPDALVRNNHYTNLRPMWHIDNISRTYEEFK